LFFSSVAAVSDDVWVAWQQEHGRVYNSVEEESYRRSVFEARLEEAALLQKENPLAEFGATKFSDWTHEEIKERLAATVQAPKFVREIKEIRIKEGMRGKFEAGFAGNPKPEITWWFNGQQMQNSKNVQIKLREDSSTLTLIDCSFDMAGIYECRAVNDQGNDKCRASLSVNKLTTEEKAEYEKAKSEGLLDLVDDEEEKVKEKKKVKEEQKKEKQKK